MSNSLSPAELAELAEAKQLLERTSLAARLANLLGSPIEKGLDLLPGPAQESIHAATTKSLTTALEVALTTLGEHSGRPAKNWMHKTLVGASGAAGGALGLPAIAVELPLSTTIILRSIADIARSEGEDLTDPATKLACLEVFALGGPGSEDDAAESGYLAVRLAMSKAVADAVEHVARHGATQQTAPAMVRLIAQIASRFGVPVSQKVVAQSLPLIGAAGGAMINTLFIDHFQSISRGHFIVRRLERAHGIELVQAAYRELPSS